MKKIFKLGIVLFFCLIILTGCAEENPSTLQDKNSAELGYIETNCIEILNKFAKQEYEMDEISDEEVADKIDWEKVLEDTNKIEKSVGTTLVDLAALNIEGSEISKLSTGVNNMIIAAENKSVDTYLVELNNVCALLPGYLEKYSKDNELIFKKRLKYYILSTYVAYNQGNLDMAKTQIAEAEKIYSEKMKDVEYVKSNEYNLNKLYVLIQELKQAVELNSTELVRSKYLLVIDEV